MLDSNPESGDPLIAVRAEGLSKCYRIYDHPRDRLLQAIWGRDRKGRPKQYFREFWALRELSFQLERGQTLGVVGRNGSGKSTLLQLLCGTLEPTTGTVDLQGRLGALLELGSGFNPEFTGLENVYLNASLLGLSRAETRERLDLILAFADIGEFIHQPVKTYSSGMAVRLAFAVQAHTDPDVLVVDEALAVGDELFQKKCYAHLEQLKERGTAVLLVTHSCQQIVQHCDQALLLHKGQARMLGQPAKVTLTYQRLMNASDAEWEQALNQNLQANTQNATLVDRDFTGPKAQSSAHPDTGIDKAWFDPNLVPNSTEIYPSHGARITDVWIETTNGQRVNSLPRGQAFTLVFCYASDQEIRGFAMACHIVNHTGLQISGQSLPRSIGPHSEGHLKGMPAGMEWQVRYSFSGGFWPGTYFIGGGILSTDSPGLHYIHRVIDYRAFRILDDLPVSAIGVAALEASEPELICP